MTDVTGRPRRHGCLARVLVGLLVLLLGVAFSAAIAWWALFMRQAVEVAPGETIEVEIPKGSTTAEIGRILADSGVVANANRFRLESRLDEADGELRAGIYEMRTGMGYGAAIELLLAGPPIQYYTVAIPEGFTVDQVAARVSKVTGLPLAEVSALAKKGADSFGRPYLKGAYGGSLEGYLFPKTYRVKEGSTAKEVLSMMLDQFERETAALDLGHARRYGMDLADVVVIASMVEREAKVPKEQKLVSSVIYNRLVRGMRLEIDATLQYVMPDRKFRLRNSDLRLNSPYNTYAHKGLPPGPIASPGAGALRAAAQPAQTEYLYYVLTGKDGSHTFARTEPEFLAAKRKSKEVFGR